MALLRFVLACWLYFVGVIFLSANTSTADLILDAIALAFVLQLDTLIFSALHALTGWSFNTSVRAADPPMVPSPTSACHDHWVGLSRALMLLFLFGSTAFFCFAQRRQLHGQFDALAHTCLFAGPAPTISQSADLTELFPVPGFCETLLDCKMMNSGGGGLQSVCKTAEGMYHNVNLQSLAVACERMYHPLNSTFPNSREADPSLLCLG